MVIHHSVTFPRLQIIFGVKGWKIKIFDDANNNNIMTTLIVFGCVHKISFGLKICKNEYTFDTA